MQTKVRKAIESLTDDTKPLSTKILSALTDLEDKSLMFFKETWQHLSEHRKITLLEDLEELTQADTVLSFEQIARIALNDPSPKVRFLAIRSLLEYDDIGDLASNIIQIMENDPDIEVQSIAAHVLGKFVYMGEVDQLPNATLTEIEDSLLRVAQSSAPPMLRRRVLEALGFSSREEVNKLIQQAYDKQKPDWVASALIAMGRSLNSDWKELVTINLDHENENVRYEAVRAAGELELKEAVPKLIQMSTEEESEIRAVAIWALSQIGGDGVRDHFYRLLELTEDDYEISFLEDAIDNLSFNEGIGFYDLLEIDEPNLDDKTRWIIEDHPE